MTHGREEQSPMEKFAIALHEKLGLTLPIIRGQRILVAACLGYLDAKSMVFYKETYGLPLEIYSDMARKKFGNLKIDYGGLEHELLMIGTNQSTVESMLQELRLSDREWSSLDDA